MGEITIDDFAAAAAVSMAGGTRKTILELREKCHQRNYHRVSTDKPDPNSLEPKFLVCYDCEIFFEKDPELGFPYKVEPV